MLYYLIIWYYPVINIVRYYIPVHLNYDWIKKYALNAVKFAKLMKI